jgi:hypothetical protein
MYLKGIALSVRNKEDKTKENVLLLGLKEVGALSCIMRQLARSLPPIHLTLRNITTISCTLNHYD